MSKILNPSLDVKPYWTYEAKCTSPGAVCVQWGGDFCHWPRPRCLDHTRLMS